jgi:hypothetical protein
MNELLTKKKEFEDSIAESDKQIEQLKTSKKYAEKHLKLIMEQIELSEKSGKL